MSDARGGEYDHLVKLLLIGDSGVGKTSILIRYATGEFDENKAPTVGVDLKVKLKRINKTNLKLTIWDTAGSERFMTLTSAYYRGAHGIVLVYDVTSRESFEHVQVWLDEIDNYATDQRCARMLVANKVDCKGQRQVSEEEGHAFAKEHGLLFIETSAKTELGISQAFEELCQKIMDTDGLLVNDTTANTGIGGRGGGEHEVNSCGCT